MNQLAHLLSRRITAVLIIVVLLIPALDGQATRIPDELKKIVAFIFVPGPDGKPIPNGTGFFVGVKLADNPERSHVYLVTAKHVLQDPQGAFFPTVWVRLNKRDGGTDLAQLDLGPERRVFTHPDETVDIAVIPALPPEHMIDFKFLGEDLLTTKEEFKDLKISEGADVFFTGLFMGHFGQQRNQPIVRFGRVALVTEEKILWKDLRNNPTMVQLYLIETFSFAGNSGSPVFFYLGSDREPGTIIAGPPVLRLAGIMRGSFDEGRPLTVLQTDRVPLSIQNLGIAAVTPSYLLHEILFSKDLVDVRARMK